MADNDKKTDILETDFVAWSHPVEFGGIQLYPDLDTIRVNNFLNEIKNNGEIPVVAIDGISSFDTVEGIARTSIVIPEGSYMVGADASLVYFYDENVNGENLLVGGIGLALLGYLWRFGHEVKDMKSSTDGMSRRDFLRTLGITTAMMVTSPIVLSLGSVVSALLADNNVDRPDFLIDETIAAKSFGRNIFIAAKMKIVNMVLDYSIPDTDFNSLAVMGTGHFSREQFGYANTVLGADVSARRAFVEDFTSILHKDIKEKIESGVKNKDGSDINIEEYLRVTLQELMSVKLFYKNDQGEFSTVPMDHQLLQETVQEHFYLLNQYWGIDDIPTFVRGIILIES